MSFQVDIGFVTCCLGLGHLHLDCANLKMQTYFVPKIIHQNLAIILKAVVLRQHFAITQLP